MWSGNIIELITTILVWIVIFICTYRVYKKQGEKPKLWKIAVVLIVGIFSFSINLPIFKISISFAILPLGVWILFAILNKKEERWNKYRSYAWLGFWSNYLFLIAFIVSILLHHVLYPKNTIHTYISNSVESEIINIHPSANERTTLSGNWLRFLDEFKEGQFFDETWYEETYMIADKNKRNERFPYVLTNTTPKWGSGLNVTVFIESDGKGLLVLTSQENVYFRSEISIFEEGNR